MRLLFYSALEEHELAERFFNEFVSKVYEFIRGISNSGKRTVQCVK